MNLEEAIRRYYTQACNSQRELEVNDSKMKSIMQGSVGFDSQAVRAWMESYNLFQGIYGSNRNQIVAAIPNCLGKINSPWLAKDRESAVADKFSVLFTELYNTKKRKWLSATSKLLWCLFPDEIVIYDSFVERFIIVMQWFDEELVNLPRLGNVPRLSSSADISRITAYYMRYQRMVYRLFQRHLRTLQQLRAENREKYPHDIRIFDKILWITSNSGKDQSA